MLNLNLLPTAEKVNLAYEMRMRAVMRVGSYVVTALTITFILLLPTMFFVSFQSSEVTRALNLERKQEEQSGLAKELDRVKTVNRIAVIVTHNMQARALLSPLIAGILSATPADVSLSVVTYKTASRVITIEGFAPTRSSLLAFIASLERDPMVASVSSPVSNVIHEANIVFSITIALR